MEPASRLGVQVRSVVVEAVQRETPNAVSLVLSDPTGAPFEFSPGQYLTVAVELAGEIVRRSYSISSSAEDTRTATITVKRIAGGKLSGHLVEHARAGMRFDVVGPAGSFTLSDSTGPRRLVLIAGGSGITPLMSIARTTLTREPEASIRLLYANRNEQDIIFGDALAREQSSRMVVRHVLGEVLDREAVARELDALTNGFAFGGSDAEYFVCGPEAMMHQVRTALLERGVPPAAVREERFTLAQPPHVAPPAASSGSAARAAGAVQLRVLRSTDTAPIAEIRIPTDMTILQAALGAGVELPHSCTEGVCGACRVRAVDPGAVEMPMLNCLSSREIKDGYVLTCVSRARRDLQLVLA